MCDKDAQDATSITSTVFGQGFAEGPSSAVHLFQVVPEFSLRHSV